MPPARASTSPGGTRTAPSPTTSGTAPAARRHDRHAGGHGFSGGNPNPSYTDGNASTAAPASQASSVAVVDVPELHDPSRHGDAASASSNRSAPQPSPPDDDQRHVGMGTGHGAEGRHQQRVVLAGLDRAHGQDVRDAPAGNGRSTGAEALVPRRRGARAGAGGGHAVVHGPHPRGVDAELGHHLVGHELRRRVHPGPFGDGAADHAGNPSVDRSHSSRVADGGEVVHGHHPGGPAGRRAPRSWCRGPRRPARRTTPPAGPSRAPRPGAADGPAWPAARRRHRGGHEGSATADVGATSRRRRPRRARAPWPRRTQGACTEHADARSADREGRGVDGDGQPALVGGAVAPAPASLAHPAAGVRAGGGAGPGGRRPAASDGRSNPLALCRLITALARRSRVPPWPPAWVRHGSCGHDRGRRAPRDHRGREHRRRHRLHGLHICPDLDTVTYTLAEPSTTTSGAGGWPARPGPSWSPRAAGGQTWFRLGDRDLATHLYRTQRLAEGRRCRGHRGDHPVASGWRSVSCRSPTTAAHPAALVGGPEVGFQEYFVHLRHAVAVDRCRFAGPRRPAGPRRAGGPRRRRAVVVCPSNPVVSIGPLLAVPGSPRRSRPGVACRGRVPHRRRGRTQGPRRPPHDGAGLRVLGRRSGPHVRRLGWDPRDRRRRRPLAPAVEA